MKTICVRVPKTICVRVPKAIERILFKQAHQTETTFAAHVRIALERYVGEIMSEGTRLQDGSVKAASQEMHQIYDAYQDEDCQKVDL